MLIAHLFSPRKRPITLSIQVKVIHFFTFSVSHAIRISEHPKFFTWYCPDVAPSHFNTARQIFHVVICTFALQRKEPWFTPRKRHKSLQTSKCTPGFSKILNWNKFRNVRKTKWVWKQKEVLEEECSSVLFSIQMCVLGLFDCFTSC